MAKTGKTDDGLSRARGAQVKVLFPLPLFKTYDYIALDGVDLCLGAWVRAPFGPRSLTGVVWSGGGGEAVPAEKLKNVEAVIDAPPLAAEIIEYVDWVAAYTMFPIGAVLRMVMRSGDALSPPKGVLGYVAVDDAPSRMTPQRQAVLKAASKTTPSTARVLSEAAGVGEGVVSGLVKAGALKPVAIDPDPPFEEPDLDQHGRDLSEAQSRAAAALVDRIESGAGGTVLIDGVTGSGKTEVYLEAAAAALKKDPAAQVLILIPEIALTLPFLNRVEERFNAAPAPWHSDMSAAARRRTWRRVLEGQARLVVGARSALFLPFRNLRLIVVDEEHDAAYKQEDGVIYQARDMAVVRGAKARFPVILASATPSLETTVNVARGRYQSARLPARFGGASAPALELIDMRRNAPAPGSWLAPPLCDAVDETLARGEQALFFLNRRGYAPLTICRRCGHRMKAPDSDTWLVEHRFENKLVCHHTGFSMEKPEACPACNAVGGLSACGPGVERVAEEARARWPDAKLAVLSSDTAPTPAAMRAILEAMQSGETDIMVATQVVAKGHHFPNLTLVGVVDADLGLSGGDLRAAERTYQLLTQVAGRAGRAGKAGRALLQTYKPSAPVFEALVAGDRDAFLLAEAEGRRQLTFPPFGRLASILLRSKNEAVANDAARALARAAPRADGVEVWGPAPAPFYRLRGETRVRLLVKTRRDVNLQAYLNAWLSRVKSPASVRRIVDIDPYSFL
ncbi:MAG: primosomal protein N' [Parvularculaceae bacterium]